MNVTHLDVVQDEAARDPAAQTVDGALAFTLRVIARLNARFPGERAGLLIKTAGENIVAYGGTSVSAGRICYPDQQLYKVLTDIPATNGPQWLDDGLARVGGYIGGYLAVAGVAPVLEPPPAPVIDPPPPSDLPGVAERLAALEAKVDALLHKAPPSYVGSVTLWGATSKALFEPVKEP
jgi:hypothetical protein